MTDLFKNPAPTFDDPLEMLVACHGRIEERCETLLSLSRHLPAHGVDAQAIQAASNILRYFDKAGRHHHDDEEKDLFPTLLNTVSAAERPAVSKLIENLLHDHQEMNRAWTTLRGRLIQISNGKTEVLLPKDAETFARLYADHMTREESQLLPLAKRLLSSEQIDSLGQSMSRRRGAKI